MAVRDSLSTPEFLSHFVPGMRSNLPKSLRLLFAKDILEDLRSGDNVDRLHACMALQEAKSPSKLGRFSHDICLELLKTVQHVRVGKMAVREEVRLEALQAFAHFRLPQANKVYPFLNEKLQRCKRPSDELRSKLDSLLAVLDAEMAKPLQEPGNCNHDVRGAVPMLVPGCRRFQQDFWDKAQR